MASIALIWTSRPASVHHSDADALTSASTRFGGIDSNSSMQRKDPVQPSQVTAAMGGRAASLHDRIDSCRTCSRRSTLSIKRVGIAAVLFSTVLVCQAQGGTSAEPDIAAPVAKNTYVIGPADVLSITVWKEPALSETIPVRPDGMVSMALLGDLQAAGFTPMQLTADVTNRLKHFVQDPRVSVVVTAVNSQRVFLLGEIAHSGPVPLTPGMTALQAISTGGGLTQFANVKKIYVIRDENGKQEKIAVKYKQALRGDTNENVVLRSGDTIVVP
jgi:polysaccharide biosynthesis/export protein